MAKLKASHVRGYNAHVMWRNSVEIAEKNVMMALKLRPFVSGVDTMDVDS